MERPILFSTPMVQAILAGRKTQTRRLVKETGKAAGFKIAVMPDGTRLPFNIDEEEGMLDYIKCPYGKTGDVLWVRETWNTERKYPCALEEPNKSAVNYIYKADKQSHVSNIMRWKPSIFMPKGACRIKLLIKDIRVQRLQDISEEDAKAEGIYFYGWDDPETTDYKNYSYKDTFGDDWGVLTAKESYQTLWESINGKDSWQKNPWVWVITFSKV